MHTIKFLILSIIMVASSIFIASDLFAAGSSFEQVPVEKPINVSAKFKNKTNKKPVKKIARKPLTASQKLKQVRRYYEKRNEIYAKQKIEQWRLKNEVARHKKLKAIFDAQLKAIENL